MAKVKVKILQNRYGDSRRKFVAGQIVLMDEGKARWAEWVEILPTPSPSVEKKTATSPKAESRQTAARETKSGRAAPAKRGTSKRKSSSKRRKKSD